MNFKNLAYCLIVVLIVPQIYSQQVDNKKNENINTNKFRQLYQEFSSPNIYRAASGHLVLLTTNNRQTTKLMSN